MRQTKLLRGESGLCCAGWGRWREEKRQVSKEAERSVQRALVGKSVDNVALP
jgi:hypothetical protein